MKLIIMLSIIYDYLKYKCMRIATNIFGNGNVESKKGKYEVTFFIDSIEYKMIFKKKRGPPSILSFEHEGKDVTEEIVKYMGPSNNFYGIPTTPSMLGFDTLDVTYVDGRVVNYSPKSSIQI